MLRRELDTLTNQKNSKEGGQKWNGKSKEPVARFLKSYAVFISDHTGKEDTFFTTIQQKGSISREEDLQLMGHYESCRNEAGRSARIEEMIKLIGYLESREWMR
jgi:hypothetical protein